MPIEVVDMHQKHGKQTHTHVACLVRKKNRTCRLWGPAPWDSGWLEFLVCLPGHLRNISARSSTSPPLLRLVPALAHDRVAFGQCMLWIYWLGIVRVVLYRQRESNTQMAPPQSNSLGVWFFLNSQCSSYRNFMKLTFVQDNLIPKQQGYSSDCDPSPFVSPPYHKHQVGII